MIIRLRDGSLSTSNLVLRDFLLFSKLEVLCALDAQLLLSLAFLALKTECDLLGGLGLFVKNGLGLTTETHLLVVVPSLTLSEVGSLASLVLGNLMKSVLTALLAFAESLSLLRNVNHL
mmetsp:Transcript_13448/g.20227  ORF Transcript_13448/g.20227 Transcript_13448/m.20227 type:complete len:119 (-) Transcript_13448:70-426(-)